MQNRWSRSGKSLLQLVKSDRETARLWLLRIPEVDTLIGKPDRLWCTDFLNRVAKEDPRMAQNMVLSLPDGMSKVPETERHRYQVVLSKLGFQPLSFLPDLSVALIDLLTVFNDAQLIRFVMQAQDIFKDNPQKGRTFLKRSSETSQRAAEALHEGVSLSSLSPILTYYARAHCHHTVIIRSGGQKSFVDGVHIYLPDRLSLGQGEAVDRLAYRVLTARNVGFLEFGSLDLVLEDIEGPWLSAREGELPLERCFRSFPNTQLAKDLFWIVEHRRIETKTRAKYPGVARAMDELGQVWRPKRPNLNDAQPVEELVEALYRIGIGEAGVHLQHPQAALVFETLKPLVLSPADSVADSIRTLVSCYESAYQLMRQTQASDQEDYSALQPEPLRGAVSLSMMDEADRQKELLVHDTLTELRATDGTADLAEARRIAEDYFTQADFLERLEAPSGVLRDPKAEDDDSTGLRKATLQEGVEHVGEGILYPEWDMRIDDIKPDWTQVFECQVSAGSLDFVTQTKLDFGIEIHKLRRVFESLRPEGLQRRHGLEDGDIIDIDRAIEARLDKRMGLMPSPRLYSAIRTEHRDTAVAFLVDMSSSTNDLANDDTKRILDVEKEALIVLSEAIDALGDAFAIYGYSGFGRSQVAFYIAKNFDDPWNEDSQSRVGQMRWMMENRDGAAIRHCASKLKDRSERHRLMILLSDGKPLDCGCVDYADAYAQADTHAAILEARQQGVHVFCITVDPYGQKYLKELYGEGGYTVIEQVSALPERLPAIYHRLTS
ncbi:MAG: VWA domain-containing protein [Myxococcota bacterium]|nr:VWA domain-containing protein [Myxococcota bacterium]